MAHVDRYPNVARAAQGGKMKYVDHSLAQILHDCESKGRDPESVHVKGALFWEPCAQCDMRPATNVEWGAPLCGTCAASTELGDGGADRG